MAKVIVYEMVRHEVEVDDKLRELIGRSHQEIKSEEEHDEWLAAGDKIAEMVGSKWAEGDYVKFRKADGTVEEFYYKYGNGVMAVVSDTGYILSAL